MAYRKTYEGLTANGSKSIEIPIELLFDTRNGLDRYLEIFTRNTDLYQNRRVKFPYENDKDHIIQVIIWMNFELMFHKIYSNNYVELCPRFSSNTHPSPGNDRIKIDIMARFGPGDSVEEVEEYLKEYYDISYISEGG